MIKQVIVIRKDLHMRRGKEIAQACHASMKVVSEKMYLENGRIMMNVNNEILRDWLFGIFTKISLYCISEKELLDLYKQAIASELLCSLIKDSGKTEFHGAKTYTCIAIGPGEAEEIDKITGHLKLL